MKKIRFAILLLAAGCSSPELPKQEKAPVITSTELDTFYLGSTLVKVERINKSEFDQAQGDESEQADGEHIQISDSNIVQRKGDSLWIFTEKGRVSFINRPSDGDDVEEYRYLGYNRDIRQYVVMGSYWEWFNYYLVDAASGDSLCVYGTPVISPSKTWFACGNGDLLAGMTYNGLAIFKNTQPPTKIGERELRDWGPKSLRWTKRDELLVEALEFDTTSSTHEKITYLKLLFQKP